MCISERASGRRICNYPVHKKKLLKGEKEEQSRLCVDGYGYHLMPSSYLRVQGSLSLLLYVRNEFLMISFIVCTHVLKRCLMDECL
jgi:hypothetical protein